MLIPEFQRWMERRQIRPKTIKSYTAKVSIFIAWGEEQKKDITETDPDIIWRFHEHLALQRNQRPATRALYLHALKSYFDFLITREIFKENPARSIAMPKVQAAPPRTLDEEEITRLMNAVFENKTEKGLRDLAIISVLAGTACRVGALTEMRIMDFWPKEEIFPEQCQHCGQYLLSGRFSGRGKKIKVTMVRLREKAGKEWDVLLPDKAAFYLTQYLNNRKIGLETDIVFPVKRHGTIKPITRHGVLYMLKRYAARAGLTKTISPHVFRHAAITWWLDYGVDPETVQRWVGHRLLQQTLEYRNKSMRSYVQSGIATDRNLLDRIETPMDVLFHKMRK